MYRTVKGRLRQKMHKLIYSNTHSDPSADIDHRLQNDLAIQPEFPAMDIIEV